ncbi:hypothetical protein [Chryseobacterium oranimense]|uniref:hypothetical protein n=1 Tax=Chryseobacterium oranimense TaxID=421058 RepID=UPI002236AB13|nr:hypothetical protein [Chryseobacterium oranimense]
MKNLILFLFIIVCANYKSQIFECNNIDRYELNYIYKQNENKFKVVIGDINYMQKSIDGLEINVIKQICINNWTIYDKNGADYMHKRFVDYNGSIDKGYYLKNAGYLEVLSYLKYKIKSTVK